MNAEPIRTAPEDRVSIPHRIVYGLENQDAEFCLDTEEGEIVEQSDSDEDESRFIVTLKTPLGSSIGYTRNRLQAIEQVLAGGFPVSLFAEFT